MAAPGLRNRRNWRPHNPSPGTAVQFSSNQLREHSPSGATEPLMPDSSLSRWPDNVPECSDLFFNRFRLCRERRRRFRARLGWRATHFREWQERCSCGGTRLGFKPEGDAPFSSSVRLICDLPEVVRTTLSPGLVFRDRRMVRDGNDNRSLVVSLVRDLASSDAPSRGQAESALLKGSVAKARHWP